MPTLSKFLESQNKYTLYVLEGSYDHQSIDPTTTRILYLLNFNKIRNVNVVVVRHEVLSPFPMALLGEEEIPIHTFIRRLERMGDMSDWMPPRTKRSMKKYKERVRNELEPAVMLHLWHSNENKEHSLQLYTQAIRNPFKYFFTMHLKSKMQNSIQECNYIRESSDPNNIYADVVPILQDLNRLLGDKIQFFRQVSYLDIQVCALLYHVLKVDYPNQTFRGVIEENAPELIRYIDRFAQAYAASEHAKVFYTITHRFGADSPFTGDYPRRRVSRRIGALVNTFATISFVFLAIFMMCIMAMYKRYAGSYVTENDTRHYT